MYPVLFRVGSLEITSVGAMVALGFLVGYWFLSRERRRSRLSASAPDAAPYGIVGGLLGGTWLLVAAYAGEEPLVSLVSSRVRKNARALWGLTLAPVVSLGSIVTGVSMAAWRDTSSASSQRSPRTTPRRS